MDVRSLPSFRLGIYSLWAMVGIPLAFCSLGYGNWVIAFLQVDQQGPQKPVTEGAVKDTGDSPGRVVPPAQKPDATIPQKLTVPSVEGVLPPLPNSPEIEAIIRETLSNPESGASTGDPILDGVLEAAGRRGSVVKGSMFERFPSADLNANAGLLSESPAGTHGIADGRFPQSRQQAEDERCYVAEQLLVTARLLTQLPDGSISHRRQLVIEMRREAARLLSTLEPERGEYMPGSPSGFQEHPLRHLDEEHSSDAQSGELADPFAR